MDPIHWIADAIFLADWIIRSGLSVRVILRRLPVGVSLAWLMVILVLPFVGAVLYLTLVEYHLGRRRARRAAAYREACRAEQGDWALQERGPFLSFGQTRSNGKPQADAFDLTTLGAEGAALARLAQSALGAPVLPGNRLQLLGNAAAAFPALIADIDQARSTCALEFYIWSPGGQADELAAALARAAKRGVPCRVLVDAIGSKVFLRSDLARDLRQAGVQVAAALPPGLLRLFLVRPDLRLHRKIAIIDGDVGYTGSLNLADPRLFKQDAGVGQWVDALARVQGPAVDALADTFREDWALETGETLKPLRPDQGARPEGTAGKAAVQVLLTGPDARVEAIEQVVLMAIYGARREVVLTTPYFVPSESLLYALLSAAARGVEVTLIVPAKVDSRLVQYASRAFQTDLLAAGVRVALFQGGLLHTKSITVDGQFSLFGSLNLDPRSLRLDFEITLVVYDADFTSGLRRLQQHYLDGSALLDLATCRSRSVRERLAEDTARLVGPLL
jgi:cardiolipin synthase